MYDQRHVLNIVYYITQLTSPISNPRHCSSPKTMLRSGLDRCGSAGGSALQIFITSCTTEVARNGTWLGPFDRTKDGQRNADQKRRTR